MISASGLSSAIVSQQMRLPERPRVSEDLIQVWHSQRMLVLTGGASEIVLRGAAVGRLLPRLLPLLRGQLGLGEIQASLPDVAPKRVDDALMLLYMQGALEDGAATVELDSATRRQFQRELLFFSRYIDVTRASRERSEVLAKLRGATVVLAGRGPALAATATALAEIGVGTIELAALDETAPPTLTTTVLRQVAPDADLAGRQLAILIDDQVDLALWREWNARALASETPLLHCRLGGDAVEIGPAVFAGESACLECVLRTGELVPDGLPADPGLAEIAVELGSAQVAQVVLGLLTLLWPAQSGHTILRLDPVTAHFEATPTLRLPGCPACGTAADYGAPRELLVGQEHRENLPLLYHSNSADRSYILFPKSYQDHYSSANTLAIQGGFKACARPGAVSLPEAAALPDRAYGAAAPSATPLDLAALATLLRWSLTRREQGARMTPSGGNLGSQEVYVAALAVDGLEPGIYHFNHVGAMLEPVAPLDRAALAAATGFDLADAALLLIATGAYGRLESKYPFKAYQYALYDSGALLASLQQLADGLGWRLEPHSEFIDRRVAALLELHSPHELPLWIGRIARPGLEDK